MWSTLLQEALGALDRWNPGGPSDNWGTLETRGVASHLYYALYFSITPPSISLFHRRVFLCYTYLYFSVTLTCISLYYTLLPVPVRSIIGSQPEQRLAPKPCSVGGSLSLTIIHSTTLDPLR